MTIPNKMGRPVKFPPLTGNKGRDRIIALRQRLGLSQRALGERLGVRESSVRDWETGQHRPSGAAAKLLEMLEKE